MSDPYADYFARGGTVTVLPPVYRGEDAAPVVGAARTLEERVIAIHDVAAPGTLNHIKSLLGVEPETAAAILRAAGRTPRKGRAGEALRGRHARVMAGAQASAEARKAETRRRLKPMLDLLAANPTMTVKAAAEACGVKYTETVKSHARAARDR